MRGRQPVNPWMNSSRMLTTTSTRTSSTRGGRASPGGALCLDESEKGSGAAPYHLLLLHGALEVLPTSATQKEVIALYETLSSLSLVAAGNSVDLARTWRVFRLAMGAVETVQGRYSVKKVFNFWTSQLRLAVYAKDHGPHLVSCIRCTAC